MLRIKLNNSNISETAGALSKLFEKEGAVALVPTETVYGLIARAGDKVAEERIFELKKRNTSKLLGWFIGNWRKLPEYGVILDGLPEKLAEKYCPGPLTVIAPCKDGSTQGFRVPDTPFLLELLEKFNGVLVQTSANASGQPDARSCDEALSQLSGTVDIAVDGGDIEGDICGSTVVDATGDKIKILRKGTIDLQKWL